MWEEYVVVNVRKSYLSAGPPGLICVTVSGRHLPGSPLAPPRNVIPNVPPASRTNISSSRLHSTENDICSAHMYISSSSSTERVVGGRPLRPPPFTIIINRRKIIDLIVRTVCDCHFTFLPLSCRRQSIRISMTSQLAATAAAAVAMTTTI